MKALVLGLLMSTLVSTVGASTSPLPQWASGESNCKIDGRPAKMIWQVVDDPQVECDGDICSTTSGVKTVGRFSDSGSAWVELRMAGVPNRNTLNIRYLGAEQDNWQLVYDAATEVAKGWTTWRGKRYPLSCWKGEAPLPERCANYANQAIQQFQMAQQRACNVPQDARWQSNYQAHYGWCMSIKGRANALTAETKARQDTLNQCRRFSSTIRVRPEVIHVLPR
jgi:hypothetical protein